MILRPFIQNDFTNSKQPSKKGDAYILFSDESAGSKEVPDIFNRNNIANVIADSISRSSGQMNFLLSGEWGAGKTSILKMIDGKLDTEKTIWFSPWKYSGSTEGGNAISRAFLTSVANQLGKPYLMKDLYIKRQLENERNILTQLITLTQIIMRYLVYMLVAYLLLSLLVPIVLAIFPNVKAILDSIASPELIGVASAVLALPPLGQYFVSKIREQGEVEKIGTPELFELKFNELINRVVKFKRLQQIISFFEETFLKTWIAPLNKILVYVYSFNFLKLRKLVIFVDDLDRCTKEEQKQFLNAMKTFFDNKTVYYIIAADLKQVDRELLRKIIQIDWNVPHLQKIELEHFILNLLYESGAPSDIFDAKQVAHMFSLNPNPRKIKYCIRRFLFLLNYFKYESEE